MYDKELIECLGSKYRNTGQDVDFEVLLEAVHPLIDTQLGRQYSSMKHEWEDMKQEVLLKLWKNRTGLCFTKTELCSRFFYEQIRYNLNRAAEKIQGIKKNENDLVELAELKVKKYYIDDKDRDDL